MAESSSSCACVHVTLCYLAKAMAEFSSTSLHVLVSVTLCDLAKAVAESSPTFLSLQLSDTFQTHKTFKRMLFIRTRQNQQIFRVVPFVKLQNDKQHLNGQKQ